MNSNRIPLRLKGVRWLATSGLLAMAVAIGGLFGAAGAQAGPESVAGNASLTWKVSQYAWTFSSLAQAQDAIAPAIKDSDNGFVFPEGSGTYDPDTGAAQIDFTGALQLGNNTQGGYKIQFVDPSIVIGTGGTGSLIADVSYCTSAANCANPWILVPNVVIVNFDVDNGTFSDDGSQVSLTVTPEFPLQGDTANPARRQFPPSLIGTIGDTPAFSTGALASSLAAHFRESGSTNDPNKPPAPITLTFAYGSAPEGVTQTITTSVVEAGGIVISVSGDQVVLPSPELEPGGDYLVSTGAINEVTVTDLRSANPGWNVSGQVSDFVSGSDSFSGNLLGWTPEVVSSSTGQVVTAGGAVAPGSGLGSPATLGSAIAGEGRGTAVLGAGLDLELPTDTPPGEYSATLTLTVI